MAKIEKRENTKDGLLSFTEVICPEIEPGIISKAMIERAHREDGYSEEEMPPIVFDRIKSIRLDFKNILRIDHLWILTNLTKLALNCNKIEVIENLEMLTNLKELDLSFNYIERIENLEKLLNLEVLSLFGNAIKKLENLDLLAKLEILSIGNNLISSTDGIERFRFLSNLRVLNLEGNPLANKPSFSLAEYAAAVLPQLKYYEYVGIKDDYRADARKRFSRELREIETNEEKELMERAQKAKEDQDAEQLSLGFVEHLNEHQLYHSLWKTDEDGKVLLMVGPITEDLTDEYKKDMYDITQEIYKLGLKRYEERKLVIDKFMRNLKAGHLKIQKISEKILDRFVAFKDQKFEEVSACHRYLEGRLARGEEMETQESIEYTDRLERSYVEFDDMVNDVWQQLMSEEMRIHEATEEVTVEFQRRLTEMMATFVEQTQTYFGQLRDIVIQFSSNLADLVTGYIATKLATNDVNNVPEPLKNCLEDREAVGNLIAGMKDTHIQIIDEREDRLSTRSKEFIDNMINDLNENELKRNRAKVLEINKYLDLMTDKLHSLQQQFRDEQIMTES